MEHHHVSNEADGNRILRLFDRKFIKKFFTDRVLPQYPDFKEVKKIEIRPVKKYIWETTYHVVIEYDISFLTRDGKLRELPIFCTAHSHEPRKNVYNVLRYLWNNDFSQGYLTIPHPLVYSNYYKAVFYRGVKGSHLLHYIKHKDYGIVEKVVVKTAAWLAKLHSLPTEGIKNFNEKSNRIETAIPGKKKILEEMSHKHPEYLTLVKSIYDYLNEKEKKFLRSTGKRWLIHGDAHPENVIIVGRQKIAMIDFTDFCLSDHARDLGTFLQQLEYMCLRKTGDPAFTEKVKRLFLDNYQKYFGMKITDSIKERIETYYNWTAFRTALFFLLKHNPDPSRAEELLRTVCDNFKIKFQSTITEYKQ